MNNSNGQVQIVGMVVVGGVLLACYGILPYIGGGVLMTIDNAAFAFHWLGLYNPVVACAALGATIGGLIGLMRALRLQRAVFRSRTVAIVGLGALASLYFLTSLYCHTMKPTSVKPLAPIVSQNLRFN